MLVPWLGTVPCFTLQSGDQFRAKPPPALSSQQYTADYNEVNPSYSRDEEGMSGGEHLEIAGVFVGGVGFVGV
jgi:hypothetical protein